MSSRPDRAPRPGNSPFTERSSQVAAARKLTKRTGRERADRFLVEGAQAVREAIAWAGNGSGRIHHVYVTEEAGRRNTDLLVTADHAGIPVDLVTDKAAAELSETITPQGLIAVCDTVDVPITEALAARPSLVAVLVGVSDPGNAGTVVRVADAAGAGAVLFAGDTVDPHNGKCVRASTGSLFHLPIARSRDIAEVLAACRVAGLRLIAADGNAESDLDSADLTAPTAWLFGSEAHGVPKEVLTQADAALRVPIHGKAESLNLATAAAVCLYASASAQRGSSS